MVAAHGAGLDAAFARRDHDADPSPSADPEDELDGLAELGRTDGATDGRR